MCSRASPSWGGCCGAVASVGAASSRRTGGGVRGDSRRWAWLAVAAALGLDGWLKWWSLGALGEGQFQPLIPGLVSLTLLFNPGAAWGLLSGQTELLVAVRLGVGLGLLGYLLYRPLPPVRAAALALVAAGGLGNGLDKLLDGTVVDMLYSPLLSAATQALYRQDYPVFNLADVWVVLGVAVLLLGSVGKQSSKENPARP